MNTFDLALDLDKRAGVTQWVTLRQGDHNGTVLKATIYDHGVQVGGGYTCRVSIRIAGSGDEYYRETANYSNGVATVTIDEQYAAAVVGITYGYFELLQGSAVIASTEDFGVRVLQSAQEGAVPGDKYDSAIEDALAELDEATGRISQMVVDATEEYLEAHPEITTTVQDNSLTDAKLVQKGGILSRVERLWYRLANLLTDTPAESDVLTVSDAAKTPLAGLSLYGRSTQDGTPTPDAPVAIESVTPNLFHLTRQVGGTNIIASYMTDVSVEGEVLTFKANGQNPYYGAVQASGQAYTKAAGVLVPVKEGITYTLCASNPQMNQLVVTRYDSGEVSLGYVTYTANGGMITYTVPAGTAYICVRIGLNTAVTGTVYSTAFAMYEGVHPSAYAPYGNIGLHAVGRNLWSYGNRTFTRYVRVNFDMPLPAGTYTVSAVVTSADTDASTSTFTFRDANDIAVGSAALTRNSRASDVVTIARPATYCYLYSSTSASSSSNDEATWADIQVEVGTTATPYQPYAESVIPIDLQGHVLRSLPDGTRDEVTVDEYGRATLVQRVGSCTVTGDEGISWIIGSTAISNLKLFYITKESWRSFFGDLVANSTAMTRENLISDRLPANNDPFNTWVSPNVQAWVDTSAAIMIAPEEGVTTSATFNTWLQSHPLTIQYPLATPQTIDLGTVDPIPLQGPDMTAQAVPIAPFQLTYERDLNTTLARLEAAIAEVATS